MNILAISGSPRDQKTNYMVRKLLENIGGDSEFIKLSDYKISPCTSCRKCVEKPFTCSANDDMVFIKDRMVNADLIVFASPSYFDNVTGTMKNFFDRCLGLYWSGKMAGKKAILLTICGGKRPESANHVLNAMQYFCDLMKIEVIGKIGAIGGDEKSKDTDIEKLGKNLANKINISNS